MACGVLRELHIEFFPADVREIDVLPQPAVVDGRHGLVEVLACQAAYDGGNVFIIQAKIGRAIRGRNSTVELRRITKSRLDLGERVMRLLLLLLLLLLLPRCTTIMVV